MALKIEYIPIDDLKTYENNAKIHTEEQIDQIKQSIKEFGFNDPIAVWKDNVIIEGHGRLIAAQELEMDEVPVIRLDNLTDEQRRAYSLIHNKITMNTEFDFNILTEELENITNIEMPEFGFDFSISSFDDFEYAESIKEPADFKEFDENMETAHKCPRCGYEWN